MFSAAASRAFILLTIVSALSSQVVHVAHQHVICYDREGAREECADLLGRCHCHAHEDGNWPERPVEEQPGLSDDRAHLPCRDISMGQNWRESRPFPFSSAAVDYPACLTEEHSDQPERLVPSPAFGLSPPRGGGSRRSLLSALRC